MLHQTSNIIDHLKDFLENQSEDVLLNSITIIREDRADSFPLNWNLNTRF